MFCCGPAALMCEGRSQPDCFKEDRTTKEQFFEKSHCCAIAVFPRRLHQKKKKLRANVKKITNLHSLFHTKHAPSTNSMHILTLVLHVLNNGLL